MGKFRAYFKKGKVRLSEKVPESITIGNPFLDGHVEPIYRLPDAFKWAENRAKEQEWELLRVSEE